MRKKIKLQIIGQKPIDVPRQVQSVQRKGAFGRHSIPPVPLSACREPRPAAHARCFKMIFGLVAARLPTHFARSKDSRRAGRIAIQNGESRCAALFDPTQEKSHFRISGADNVRTVVLPPLCRQHANGCYQVQFEFLPWRCGITELVEPRQLLQATNRCSRPWRAALDSSDSG